VPSRPIEYTLEVHEPGSADDVAWSVTTSGPFLAIAPGDLLNPGNFDTSASSTKLLLVVKVEHILWETQAAVKHTLRVFTRVVPDTREVRLPQ